MKNKKEQTKWIHCNSCKRPTEHLLMAEADQSESEVFEEQYEISWENKCVAWQCRGCKTFTAEISSWFSEDIIEIGDAVGHSSFYPERDLELMEPKKYISIPREIKEAYYEVIRAYNSNCLLLCSVGLRMVLESILNEKRISGNNLEIKIDKAEFIPINIRKNLHGFRFLGNRAAHDLNTPDKDDIQMALYVMEDILNVVYELDYKCKIINEKFNKKGPSV